MEIWDDLGFETVGCGFHCEALFDPQEGDDPNRAELEPLSGHSVTQQDCCLDTTLMSANRVQFCCCACEDDDPLCEGAARCASVSIATLACPGSGLEFRVSIL